MEYLVGRDELNALTHEHRAVVDDYRRHYHRRVADTLAAGVRAGEFQVADVGLATLRLLDMLNGTGGWYDAAGARSAEYIPGGLRRPRHPWAAARPAR